MTNITISPQSPITQQSNGKLQMASGALYRQLPITNYKLPINQINQITNHQSPTTQSPNPPH
jgi:hypothetical protein